MAVTKKTDCIIPEVMAQMIDAKITALNKVTPYAKVDTTLQGTAGDTVTVPKWVYVGDAEDIAEGAEATPAKLTSSKVTFSIKKAMKSISLTQEAINSGYGNPVGQAETQLAKSIASKVDNDVLSALYTATTVVDESTAEIGYKGMVNAITKFADEEDDVEKVMFIHPEQETTLLKDVNFISADKFEAGVAVRGAIGKVAGCWIKKSSKVKKDETAYYCPIIKCEPDSAETEYTEDELPAVTIYLKADTDVAHEFFPKKQIHDVTAVKYYGVALTNDAKVVVAKFGLK